MIRAHRPTLFTFIHPAVLAADLRNFNDLSAHKLKRALASMALPQSLMARFGVQQPTTFAPNDDRRVIGSMLECRRMFDFSVYDEGGVTRADLDAIIVELNQSPMSMLGMVSPIDLVRAIGSGDVH